jgi:hypothetical protein
MNDLRQLQTKVDQLKRILENTHNYRLAWKNGLRDEIEKEIGRMASTVNLDLDIRKLDNIENLESLIISLGKRNSGISERLEDDLSRPFIRHGGILIYQQLFNGKILVMINYPFIEGYGEPRPPKNIAIYRPEELKRPYILRHLEELVKTVAEWEDYDDDDVNIKKIGFDMSYDIPTDE